MPQPKPASLQVSTHQVQFAFHHPDPVQPFWLALYICREASTYVERTLQIDYFLCKTNPISTQGKTNLTLYPKEVYENFIPPRTRENEPKTNPISQKPKMNLSFYWTKDYDNKPRLRVPANEPKTNPIQAQFPPPQSPHFSQLPTAEIKALRRAIPTTPNRLLVEKQCCQPSRSCRKISQYAPRAPFRIACISGRFLL